MINETEFKKAWERGDTAVEIARRAKCCRTSVPHIAKRLGLPARPDRRFRFTDQRIKEFQKVFNDPTKSVNEIAAYYGLKPAQVLDRARKCRQRGYEMLYRRCKTPRFYENQYTGTDRAPTEAEIAERAAAIRRMRQ